MNAPAAPTRTRYKVEYLDREIAAIARRAEWFEPEIREMILNAVDRFFAARSRVSKLIYRENSHAQLLDSPVFRDHWHAMLRCFSEADRLARNAWYFQGDPLASMDRGEARTGGVSVMLPDPSIPNPEALPPEPSPEPPSTPRPDPIPSTPGDRPDPDTPGELPYPEVQPPPRRVDQPPVSQHGATRCGTIGFSASFDSLLS